MKRSGQRRAEFKIDGRQTNLGTFDEEKEAARAYDRMCLWCKLHGQTRRFDVRLNFYSSNYANEEAELKAIDTQAAMVQCVSIAFSSAFSLA